MATKRVTIEEMRKTKSKTDWAKVDAMTDEDIAKAIQTDPDTFELTNSDLAKMRPASEVHPEIVKAYKNVRGIQKAPTKDRITIRLDHGVVDFFKGTGKGWQTRINDILHDYIDSHHSTS